jgi:hypothetical protein
MQQRRHQRALAVLQDRLRPALAQVHAGEKGCAAGRFPDFPKGSLAESPGWALPDRRPDRFPGSGGSAATAGATIPAVWDETSRGWGHGALPPWHMPAQPDVDTVVAFAQKGMLFLCA